MSKTPQIMQLEPPNELRFKGPFSEVVTAELKLANPSRSRICFKVKTTAPKQYCVRPNSGLIEPGSSVTVAVMLQPFEFDPTEKNRHKFLVQSLVVPDGPVANQEQWWRDAPPEQVMDSKLKCVFEMSPDLQQQKVNFKTDAQAIKIKSEPSESAHETLRTEVCSLREENSALKQETVRLRKMMNISEPRELPKNVVKMMSSSGGHSYLTAAVVLIIAIAVGVAVGKFLL